MTEPSTRPPRGGAARAVVGTVLFVGALVVVTTIGVIAYVGVGIFDDDDTPSCDSEPQVLEWSDPDRGWRRTGRFRLEESQTVQVDVRLWATDGGFIQVGSTVYAVPAGEPFPDYGDGATTTRPFPGIRVGTGKEAVNEQVRLDAGTWELMVSGGASAVEVRWPC